MRILLGDDWRDGALDPERDDGDVRIAVSAWLPLAAVDGLYFERARSLRMLWNYVREIGPRATLVKVASRHGERFRNRTFVAAGVGTVVDGAAEAGLSPGARVAFVAPRHPACAERVVVGRELVVPAPAALAHLFEDGVLLRARPEGDARLDRLGDALASLAGWTRESGVALEPAPAKRALERACAELESAPWDTALRLPVDPPSAIAERRAPPPASAPAASGASLPPAVVTVAPARATAAAGTRARPAATAVLFGYGNYAKTIVLPSLPRGIRVAAIHEVDPLQIPPPSAAPRHARGAIWDTASRFGADERPDVALIAGFHHTHAALAIEALRRGAAAVVEKPIVTTEEQLAEVLDAVQPGGRRLFSCFHKRYSPFNELALADLGIAPGDPVSYHCIVYEVPLPARHWYRWPRSRSRIVSNGCHWLDHFLFLNGFPDVRDATIAAVTPDALSCAVTLANGAVFTMVLTDRGSERLGVQDHVELRAGGVTVAIANGAVYRAEGPDRVLRRRRASRLAGHRRMYAAIGRAILEGEPGDSPRSIEVSAGLMLRLERALAERATDAGDAPARRSPVAVRALQRRSA